MSFQVGGRVFAMKVINPYITELCTGSVFLAVTGYCILLWEISAACGILNIWMNALPGLHGLAAGLQPHHVGPEYSTEECHGAG